MEVLVGSPERMPLKPRLSGDIDAELPRVRSSEIS